MFRFELGEEVKDKVTGFSGIVMSRIEFLTGCRQYGVSPRKLTNDGKKPEWEYFDEDRLILKGKGVNLKVRVAGGIQPTPKKSS